MNKVKAPVLLLVVLILISLPLVASVFFLLQKERARNLALQEELEEVRTKQRLTEVKFEESKKVASALELRLQEARNQIDKLSGELGQEKTARQEALSLVEQLKTDLETQKNLRLNLEKKLSQAQNDVDKIQSQLKELLAKKVEQEKKVKELESQVQQAQAQAQIQTQTTQEQGVELGKVVVSPEVSSAQTTVKPASEEATNSPISTGEGEVLVVNKDYNFAVINLGSKDGVDIGYVFSVYHNNKVIGELKVEKVHDSMSAAGFVTADIKDKINEGDKVIRKTK